MSHGNHLKSRWRSIVALVVLMMVAAAFLGVPLLRADLLGGYGIHPHEFREQMSALSPGMTAAEIHRAVRRWDEVSTTTTRMIFTIKPRERWGILLPRLNEHIEIELDGDQRLKSARLWDG